MGQVLWQNVGELAQKAGLIPAVLQDALDRFAKLHDAMKTRLQQHFQPADQAFVITLDSGEERGAVSGREFADHFGKIMWTITNADPGNGGLGATNSHFAAGAWSGADAVIMATGMVQFAAWKANEVGLTYLMLHETAHTTALGVQSNNDCWASRNPALPWPSDPMWERNEKTANGIYRAIATALGISPWQQAPKGYELGKPVFDEDRALEMMRAFHGDGELRPNVGG